MSTARKPDLSEIRVRSSKLKADLSDAVSSITVSWQVGTVAELAFDVIDTGLVLASRDLLTLGTEVRWGDSKWEVGSVDRNYAGWGASSTARCRSSVAKNLRAQKSTGAEKQQTPAGYVKSRVKKAGGTSVVQDAPKWPVIKQGKDETSLDSIVSVLAEAQMAWTEFDGTLYAGTPWWAYGGGPELPTWPLTWQTKPESDVFSLTVTLSDDDREQSGTASMLVPYAVGKRMRPWHRVRLSGTGTDDDGLWLVRDVSVVLDGVSPVAVEAHRPRKSTPVAGSSGTDATTVSADATGKAAIAVAYALAQVGEPYSYNAHPPDSWDCSKLTAAAWGAAGVKLTPYSYTQASECNKIDRNSIIPGDLLFYFAGSTHHVAMYIGGGQLVEAGSPKTGVHVTSAWNSWTNANFSFAGRPKDA